MLKCPFLLLLLLLLFWTVSLIVPEVADGIPAFAWRYQLPCHFCHDGYPQLSVLGEQFKERVIVSTTT